MTALSGAATRSVAVAWRDWLRPAVAASVLFLLAALAARGGLATSHHPGDVGHYATFATRVRAGDFPYSSGFYLEYPPFSLPAFLLPEWLAPAHYLFAFKALMALCGIATILATAATLHRQRIHGRTQFLLLAPLALAPLLLGSSYLNRYDPWAALLLSLSLLAFVSHRVRIGAVFLALAFAAKTYPAAVVPIAAIWIARTAGRRGLRDAAVAFAATCVVVFGPFAVRAFGGLGNSYYTQAKRSLQIESTGASVLLVADKLGLYSIHWVRGMAIDLVGGVADATGAVTTVLQLAAVLGVAWLYLRSGRRDSQSFLLAGAGAVTAFVALGKVFSPQYTVWLTPFAPFLGAPLAAALVCAVLLATNIENTWGDWGLRNGNWTVWALTLRNLGVLTLLALVARELRRRRANLSP